MPLFEKINNHELQQILLSTDTPAPLTKIERGWLKRMLDMPASEDLLTVSLQSKLREVLAREEAFPETAELIEKGKTTVKYSPAGSLLRGLRVAIRDHCKVSLSYMKSGGEQYPNVIAVPCQLEFSMVRREWYLIWLDPEMKMCKPVTTPLRFVQDAQILGVVPNWDDHMRHFQDWLERSQDIVTILAEECYPGALLSVLNAFSCFDTQVAPGEQKNTLRLSVQCKVDEREYVLQKIRFLGRRVTVEGPEEFRERMRGTAERAMERYFEK